MYLSFRLDPSSRWAVDIRKVHRIESNCEILTLPRQKQGVLGLCRFQQYLVPVFDVRSMFGSLMEGSLDLPHLLLFYGRESLNAFPALVEETIQEECVMLENSLDLPYLDPFDLIYNDLQFHQIDFAAIEEHLNIP